MKLSSLAGGHESWADEKMSGFSDRGKIDEGDAIFGEDRENGVIGWTEVKKEPVLPVHECCGEFPNRRPYAVNNGAQQCCDDGLIVSAFLPCP